MAEKSYQAKDIQVLEGLEAVRLRPGMYIGTTGTNGLHHILWEIVDNAIDEASNGFANNIEITICADGSAMVEDDGRGIPVDIHPTLKVSGVEVVFTQLHAGGKFNSENYTFSGGLHGVGASVTNALSKWLKVEVYKGVKKYFQEFHSYTDDNGKIHSGAVVAPLVEQPSDSDKHGSKITFLPDDKVFGKAVFDIDVIIKRARELAFLNKGLQITVTDCRVDKTSPQYCNAFKYVGGLVDFVKYLNEDKDVNFNNPLYFCKKNDTLLLECAIQYSNIYVENMFSYVNNIPTPEGGTHETGFKTAYTKVFNDFARNIGALKDKDANLVGEDFREGITCVLSVKISNPQFEGQTKTKLGNVEAKPAVESLTYEGFEEILKKSVKECQEIVKKAIAAAKVREAARKAKEVTRAKNSIENANLVGKLSSCTGKNAAINEMYIVEGDSAGGSAKMGRDRKFQAILPLRGKPLNVERKRMDQVLLNEEIRTIISALNTSIGDDFDITTLKYDKVIILSDADQDGAHIRAILLTFFYRYMRELLVDGHVYLGMPPLYKVSTKSQIIYAYDDSQLEAAIKTCGRGYALQRYKGLGEMNPEQLWDTTLNPKTRTLMRVTIEDAADAEKLITTLMGDNIEARKLYISLNANFNKNKDDIIKNYKNIDKNLATKNNEDSRVNYDE